MFPDDLATLCHCVEDKLNASYFDLPFLLPIDSTKCKYNGTDTISFLGKVFFQANEKMDVCFEVSGYLQVRCFGLINISTVSHWKDSQLCPAELVPKYVFWSNFCDDELIGILDAFKGKCDIRIYAAPVRVSATLVSNSQQGGVNSINENYSYKIFNGKIISEYILKDAICKGFAIHTPSARAIWEMLLNNLLDNIRKEFETVQIVRFQPQIVPTEFLADFYNDRFSRIEDRIPNFTNDQGIKMSVITDALPFLFSKLNEGNVLFSTYTVVRPRVFGLKPFLRDEFIRYFQFEVTSDENNLDENLEKLEKAIFQFFDNIRIPIVKVDRHSDSYYLKKSCLHALWMNGNVESVLQCGILRKRYKSKSANGKIVIDVGGAQRLLATFIYNNSDIHGLFLPHHLRDYDIIIRSDRATELLDLFTKSVCGIGGRLKYVPENLSLSKIKRMAISESVIAIAVKRIVNNQEFLTIYSRDMTATNLYSDQDVTEWVSKKYRILERIPFEQQQKQIMSRINQDKLYFKTNKYYTLIKNGLFN